MDFETLNVSKKDILKLALFQLVLYSTISVLFFRKVSVLEFILIVLVYSLVILLCSFWLSQKDILYDTLATFNSIMLFIFFLVFISLFRHIISLNIMLVLGIYLVFATLISYALYHLCLE